MARVAITPQTITIDGIVPSYVSGNATDDHSVVSPRMDVFVHVVNGGAGSCIATIVAAAEAEQGVPHTDPTVTIGAGAEKVFGPFDSALFNNDDGTGVYVDLDIDTSVTIAAFRLPRVN